MKRSRIIAAVLFVGLLGFLLNRAFAQAPADPPATGSAYSTEHVRIENTADGEALCIFEHDTKKLAVYRVTNMGFELLHVRSCANDLDMVNFDNVGRTSSPKVMKKP